MTTKAKFGLAALLTLALVAAALAMGRKEAPEKLGPSAADTAATQGIAGKVEIWEGNFMPPIDPQHPRGSVTPATGRRVRAYEPVKSSGGIAQPKRESIPTPMVAEAMTDSAGLFFLRVPPGTYSVFVEEDSGWYFNGWNGEGIQGAVTVPADSIPEILIKITTKATF